MKYYKYTENLKPSMIALGAMGFCNKWDNSPYDQNHVKKSLKAVTTALERGINFFDHADIYSKGKSEQIFAELFRELKLNRSDIILQTKCGIQFPGEPRSNAPGRYNFSYRHIKDSAEKSLARLNTEYIDIFLLHRPDFLVEGEEVARAFSELYNEGKVRYFGLSNHTPWQCEYLQHFVDQPLICNQIQFNILQQDILEGELTGSGLPVSPIGSSGIVPYSRLKGIHLQAYSPLAKGFCCGRKVPDKDPSFKKKAQRVYLALQQMAEEKGVTAETIAIAWILRHPAAFMPVLGSTNPQRIEACCDAVSIELSREEWYTLLEATRGRSVP